MKKPVITKLQSLSDFLNENKKLSNIVVSYSGKFQPFHIGHYDIYEQIVKKFGKNNVYITTADLNPKYMGKSDYDHNHVFSFEEKQQIISQMFSIPVNHIVKVANTYAPKELTGMFPKETAYISIVGAKDAERLKKGKYFEEYSEDKPLLGYFDKGYYYIQENRPSVKLSATEVRNFFRNPKNDDKAKRIFFKKIYGKFNEEIYNMLNSKLNEFLAENINLTLNYTHINEGGAFGHLEHIYDDYTLTFGQLKELVNLALSNKLENSVEKCVHEDMEVILEKHGRVKIKEVVENMIIDKILSYDHTTDEIKFNDILDCANNGEETEWIEIATEHNKVLVTANHRVFVEGIGDVRAGDLTEGMIVIDI